MVLHTVCATYGTCRPKTWLIHRLLRGELRITMQWTKGWPLGQKILFVFPYLCLSPSSSSVSTSTSRSSSLSILTPQKDPFRSLRISHKTSLLGAFSTSLLPWHGNTKTQKSQPGLPHRHTRDFDVWQIGHTNWPWWFQIELISIICSLCKVSGWICQSYDRDQA